MVKQLRIHGVNVTTCKLDSDEKIEKAISLYASGLTAAEIAEQFSVGATTIQKCLHAQGVKIRGRWG
jgi:transposase